jgi:hypothetical protein
MPHVVLSRRASGGATPSQLVILYAAKADDDRGRNVAVVVYGFDGFVGAELLGLRSVHFQPSTGHSVFNLAAQRLSHGGPIGANGADEQLV